MNVRLMIKKSSGVYENIVQAVNASEIVI